LFGEVFVTFFLFITEISFTVQVTKVVPAVSEEIKEALIRNIRRRMTPQPLKIRADIEMKCFQFDGVLHIKVQFAFLALPSFPVDSVRELDHAYCG
jgi:translation initiation factor 2 alpha subunit (eIF-2alpha)